MEKKWGYKEIAAANIKAMSEALSEVSMQEEREHFSKKYTNEGMTASEISNFEEYSWATMRKHYDANGGTALVVGATTNIYAPRLYAVVNINKSGKRYARFFYRIYAAYKLFGQITGEQGI